MIPRVAMRSLLRVAMLRPGVVTTLRFAAEETTADPSTAALRSGQGLTRGGRLRFGRLAPWMDRITYGYFAKKAVPALIAFPGRMDHPFVIPTGV
jgi:hypothetical protein